MVTAAGAYSWAASRRPVAPYAADATASRGRAVPEPDCPMRTPFQRDRDRIVHATAFRRLNHKTQVFLPHEGDHYRSRLTHSLEVAQIARTLARLLHLDEDLAEALALSHDLGHPPFGHAGERALARALAEWGGFDHNAQSVAVVTRLERKYAAFDGLNLTFETLEGLAKHNGPVDREAHPLLYRAIEEAGITAALLLDRYAPAEAQVAAVADDIAYNNHDIDDGLRAGLIRLEDLAEVPIAGPLARDVLARPASPEPRRQIWEINRRMITAMVTDVAEASRAAIERTGVGSVEAVRALDGPLVAFSPGMASDIRGLRRFLFASVYRHPTVMRVMTGAESIVGDLFARYRADPEAMPGERGAHVLALPEGARPRIISDFIAGMTDRFAIAEHRRLFDATPDLR